MTCIHPRRAGLACVILIAIGTCGAAFAKPPQAAKKLYGQLLLKTREPEFYKTYGVPDTFDGRSCLALAKETASS